MAAITAAAIAGSAITASTIAAGVSTAAAVGGAAMSFKQAGDARAKAADATQAADKAIAEAKKNLDVNFYDALAIQKEPYELQREALLSQGAEAVRAAQEGDQRGVGATVGRTLMAQNEAQAGIRTAMGQELSGLAKLSAAEDSRLRDVGAQISMEEAAGAQLARANYENLAGRAETQGMQGLVQAGQSLASSIPLYMKDAEAAKKLADEATNARMQGLRDAQGQYEAFNLGNLRNAQGQYDAFNLANMRGAQGQYDAYNLANMRGAQGQYEALQRIPTLSINPFDVTGLRNAQKNIVAPF